MIDHSTNRAVPSAPTGSTAASRAAPAIWRSGLAILIAGLMLALRYNLLDHADELVDLWKLSDGDLPGAIIWAVAMLLMVIGWLGGMRAARGVTLRDAWLPVIGVTALTMIVFVLVYPATAIDVYIYAARSHLFTDYGLNPSTVTPDRLWESDSYLRYASGEWGDDTSPYGPLWNIIAAPATALDGGSIQTAVLIFKAMMVAGTLATGALLYDIARRVQPRFALSVAIGWLWCPIVLWEGVANSHNDVLFILLVVAALWCWVAGHDGGVVPLLGAAALLKVVAVMLIPAAIVAIVVRTGWNRRLLVAATQTASVSIAILGIAFAPFYDIVGTVDAIQSQRDVWVTSPALLVATITDELGLAFDFGSIYKQSSTAMIALLTIGGAVATWRRPERLPQVGFEQFFWFTLLATSNMRPWYVIWLVALALVLPLGMPFARAAAWCIGALAAYFYTSWIQNWTDPTWPERLSITLAITLVPVLFVTAWATPRRNPIASDPVKET